MTVEFEEWLKTRNPSVSNAALRSVIESRCPVTLKKHRFTNKTAFGDPYESFICEDCSAEKAGERRTNATPA